MSIKINNDTANGSSTLQPSNTATGDVTHTLPAFTTELAPRMQLMTAQNANGTWIDFTGIPAWAKKITVMFNGVSTNGASNLLVQLGTVGGLETSGYDCGVIQATNTAVSTIGAILTVGIGSASVLSGVQQINLATGNSFVFSANVSETSTPRMCSSAGRKSLSGILDRIRVTTVNGTDTFDAGQINVLYEG